MNLRFLSTVLCSLTLATPALAVEPGTPVPACTLKSWGTETPVDPGRFKGQVLYVDFWASWCMPCVHSFSFMNALYRELRVQGLQVLAINLDENPEDARTFLARHPADFIVAVDASGRCPESFGVLGMPSSFLVDRRGVVRHAHLGFRPGEAEELRKLVEELLAESGAKPAN
jgi:peroxiredoxin